MWCLFSLFTIYSDIHRDALNEIKGDFLDAQMVFPSDRNFDIGKRVIQALLNEKEIKYDRFHELFPDVELADELLSWKVFSPSFAKRTVTFKSHLVEVFVKENLPMFTETKRKSFFTG